MQRSIWIVVLPLFLLLLIGVALVSCCHLDIGNSVQSNFQTVFNFEMASESVKRGVKRLLQEHSAENYESGEMVQKSNRINSKRWRRMFNSESAEESMQCHNVDAFEHPENQYEGGDQNTAAVVITPRRVSRRMRQLLEQYCPQNHETGDTVEEGRPESNSSDSQTEHYDGRFRVDDQCTILAADEGSFVAGGHCSQSVGQALYQRSKQGCLLKVF
ncbi:uncharacterized protein LOC133740220 [Rosa rugosa]|uniref:uncharacterized protein LOC133740220 n=1 Tax=Rosa rugosa TaxID=74645 RepID=UPI002B403747|nr:uncharacterized protein LOC133740220 [Rosa rugosa]